MLLRRRWIGANGRTRWQRYVLVLDECGVSNSLAICDIGRRAAPSQSFYRRDHGGRSHCGDYCVGCWCSGRGACATGGLPVSQHQHTHTHTHGVKVSTPFRLLRAFNGLKWNVQITKCARIRREKEIKLSLYNLFKTNYVLAWRAELKHTKIAEEANNASAGESTSVWSWRLLRTHDPHNSVDWIALIEIVRSHSGANRKFHGHFTISSYRISDTVN